MFFYQFIYWLFEVLFSAIIARMLLSFIDQTQRWAVSQFIFSITEPLLGPIRRILPATGMFDFSPMIVLILLQVVKNVLLH